MTVNLATAVRANATYRKNLGWTPAELGFAPSVPDTDFVNGIATTQKQLGVTADGICGPVTYGLILKGTQDDYVEHASNLVGDNKMIVIGKAAVIAARRAWLLDIVDGKPGTFPERSRAWIDVIVRTPEGVNWNWLPAYRGDGEFEWCLTFVAYAYAQVCSLELKTVRRIFFPSTLRLDALVHYRRWEDTPAVAKPLNGPLIQVIELDELSQAHQCVFPDGSLPREGDIVLVGGVHTGPGRHGVIATGYNPATGSFTTLEGNATGLGPRGDIRQGIIRSTRRVGLIPGADPKTYHVRRVIRLAPHLLA